MKTRRRENNSSKFLCQKFFHCYQVIRTILNPRMTKRTAEKKGEKEKRRKRRKKDNKK